MKIEINTAKKQGCFLIHSRCSQMLIFSFLLPLTLFRRENLAIQDKEVTSGFPFLLSKDRVGLWYLVYISMTCIPRHTHPEGFVSLTSSYVMSRCRALDLFPQGPVSKSLLIAPGCELYERERPTHVPHLKHQA